MPPQSQNESDAVALFKEANLAYFFHGRLSPVMEEMNRLDSFSEGRTDFMCAELLESFLWLHLGLRVNYFPIEMSRRMVYEYFHLFLRAYEKISAAKLMESWFTPPLRFIWEAEFTGRQELFSFGDRWDDSEISQILRSAFQSLFVLANGFAQHSKVRELLLTMVIATESQWEEAIQKNKPIESFEDIDAPSLGPVSHWTHVGFFEVLDYMRAFRRAEVEAREMLEGSRPKHIYPEMQQFIYLLREAQLWRLNFGYTIYRGRFLRVARLAAEAFADEAESERGEVTRKAGEEFIKELYPLMTDWGAPQVASAY